MLRGLTILLLFFMCSCHQLQVPALHQLSFDPLYLDRSISKMNIDTIFIIRKNQSPEYNKSETYQAYDRNGRMVSCKLGTGIAFYQLEYLYDSLNRVKQKSVHTDFVANYYCTYGELTSTKIIQRPDADNKLWMLEQYWTGNEIDTCYFYFDQTGKLIESYEYSNNSSGKGYLQRHQYFYNDGQLVTQKDSSMINKAYILNVEKEYGIKFPIRHETNYYYHGSELDSSVTKSYTIKSGLSEVNKSFYRNGIIEKIVTNDSIITEFVFHSPD